MDALWPPPAGALRSPSAGGVACLAASASSPKPSSSSTSPFAGGGGGGGGAFHQQDDAGYDPMSPNPSSSPSPRAGAGNQSPRAGGKQSDGTGHKTFDVSIRMGISSGSVAINVFGTKSPVYFGTCGSEVDIARLLALSQPENAPPSTEDGAVEDGETEEEAAEESRISTQAVLSDSANDLVQDGYFTAPASSLQDVDAQGNKSAPVAAGAAPGDSAEGALSGWALSGKKDAFQVPGGAATQASAVTGAGSSQAIEAAVGTVGSTAGGAGGSRKGSFAKTANSTAQSAGSKGWATGSARGRGDGSMLSLTPRRPVAAAHPFRQGVLSNKNRGLNCPPSTQQMLSPRMLSARLKPTVRSRVRPPADMRSVNSQAQALGGRLPAAPRVVSPMSLYGRGPFKPDSSGVGSLTARA